MGTIRLIGRSGEILSLAVAIGLIVAFGVFGQAAPIMQFVNSDSLLPAHMAWDVGHHSGAWSTFQWPRVISLPDIAFFMAAQAAGLDWRLGFLIYTWLIALTMTGAIAALVARVRCVPFARALLGSGLLVGAALLCAVLAAGAWPDQPIAWMPLLFVLVPVTHGIGFVLSLFAARVALDTALGNSRRGLVGLALCVVGTFSDTLFLVYFLLPFLAATAVSEAIGDPAGLKARHVGTALCRATMRGLVWALACLAGLLAQQLLFHQGIADLDLNPLTDNLAWILSNMRLMPWLALGFVLVVVIPWYEMALVRRGAPQASIERCWLAWFGFTAAILGLMTVAVFQSDDSVRSYYAYRYAPAMMWWPLILILATIRRAGPALVRWSGVALALLALLLLPVARPAILGWRSVAERCVAQHRETLGLRAGLASYWTARSAMASSDWKTQIDQLTKAGDAYMWGNDVSAYQHDIHDRARRPTYNFVIADDTLDDFDISIRYGVEDHRVSCGDGIELLAYTRPIEPSGADNPPVHSFDLLSGWRPSKNYD